MTAPERIYLQPQDAGADGFLWCEDRIDDASIEYVRADLHAAVEMELSRIKAMLPKTADPETEKTPDDIDDLECDIDPPDIDDLQFDQARDQAITDQHEREDHDH